MKFDWIKYLLFITIAALLSWGGYTLCDGEAQKLPMAIVVFVSLAAGAILLCIDFETHGKRFNIKTLGILYLVISLIMNFIYVFLDFTTAGIAVPNGILLLLFVIIGYSIAKAKV